MKKRIRELNRTHGIHIMKTGYPLGRNEYLILDAERKTALDALKSIGYEAHPLWGVGHDYNYGGDLYRITKAA